MSWDELVRTHDMSQVTAIQIKHEPTGTIHFISGNYLGWFQFKHGVYFLTGPDKGKNLPYVAQTVGAIINRKGDCIMLTVFRNGNTRVDFGNVYKMKLNLKQHGIKL